MATIQEINDAVRLNSIINAREYGYDHLVAARRDNADWNRLGGQERFGKLMSDPDIYQHIAAGSGNSLISTFKTVAPYVALAVAGYGMATIATAATAATATAAPVAAGAIETVAGYDAIAAMTGAGISDATIAASIAGAASAPGVMGAAAAMAEMSGAAWGALETGAIATAATAATAAPVAAATATAAPVAAATIETVAGYDAIAAMTGAGISDATIAASIAGAASAPGVMGTAAAMGGSGLGVTDTFSIMQKIQQGAKVGDIFGGVTGTINDLAGTLVSAYGTVQGVQLQKAQIDLATQQARAAAAGGGVQPNGGAASINWTLIGLGVAALLGVFLVIKKT